ncbi:serine/threonine-protein kinase [Sphaerisporangium perillae]|uniref:serine/threonine-protein kinase n=1 Tax=Sphaerisporangium perillae TaxID=2935860 RepID=UPI00200CADD7|nr:serine/threonine-protein kinase [Sphaerisporangium perillae]
MNQDDRLGPYRLLRRLGEGGMGVVHLALDSQGRQVAVKVLRAEVTGDDVARRRLAREVETMRRVRSSHIAEVLDADVTGSRPYIVTRYVPGSPLDDTVKQDGPLEVGPLLRLAHGVAEALAAVHAAGVIHRDLKPGNVLMLDGEPVLIDFGIAQAVDATRLTQTGMFIGTPGYLAPEIIEGHEAGPEVDVHAWAGTMLYAATGLPPFGKGTLEMVFYNITAGKANVDAAHAILRPLLRAAFQRDPSRRPTAAELAGQLSRLVPPRTGQGRASVPDDIRTEPDMSGMPVTGTSLSRPDLRAEPPGAGRSPALDPRLGAVPFVPPVQPETLPGTAASGPLPGAAAAAGSGSGSGKVGDPGAASGEEFVSLLSDAPPPPSVGDPWPTVRVTGEDLRNAGIAFDRAARTPASGVTPGASGERAAEGEVPTRYAPPAPSRPWDAGRPGPLDQGEVPTRRVRPEELSELDGKAKPYGATPATPPGRPGSPGPHASPGSHGSHGFPGQDPRGSAPFPGTGSQGSSGFPAAGSSASQGAHGPVRPYHQALFEQAPDIFEQTPHVRQVAAAQSSYVPTVHLPPEATPDFGYQGQGAGDMLRRSPVYTVASVLALIIVVGAAVVLPVLVAVLVVPAAVLLRAADIAQPAFATRRPARDAATDVLRVLGRPGALLKSIGITIALVPYALILGVPVTLVLTFLIDSVPPGTALSWGVAVSLWIICAGPGVEGPARQMSRTLASAFPSKNAAMALAWVLGVVATLVAVYAVSTLIMPVGEAVWSPVNVDTWLQRLEGLRSKAG